MSRLRLFFFIAVAMQLAMARRDCQPVAVATWKFGKIAVSAAAELLRDGNAIDAVEAGVNAVELDNQEQYFVGHGGLPNENGVMELDAAIMDGRQRRNLDASHTTFWYTLALLNFSIIFFCVFMCCLHHVSMSNKMNVPHQAVNKLFHASRTVQIRKLQSNRVFLEIFFNR
jgi:hypothetical protein